MDIQQVGAAHGWRWVTGGFAIFRKSPLVWIIFVMILYLVAQLALQLPLLGVLLMLLYPVFLAGFMMGCRDLEVGRALEVGHLVAGFRHNPGQLVTIGGANLVGQLLIGIVMYVIGGPELRAILAGQPEGLDAAAMAQAANRIMAALIAGTVLSIPLLMAVWFAPLVALFNNRPAFAAIRLSFTACWRNLIPFLVYGALLTGLIMLAMIPFGIVHPQQNPGAWIVLPFVLPSIYSSYRDIFRDYA
jgi:small-conductance mechanosensitive channel